eukprot:scaffold27646_cov36-Prasinocladus_malaysianus.AAC.4
MTSSRVAEAPSCPAGLIWISLHARFPVVERLPFGRCNPSPGERNFTACTRPVEPRPIRAHFMYLESNVEPGSSPGASATFEVETEFWRPGVTPLTRRNPREKNVSVFVSLCPSLAERGNFSWP